MKSYQQEVAGTDLAYTWQLKVRIEARIPAESPFSIRLLSGTDEPDNARLLRSYVSAGKLEVDVVMQHHRPCTRREEARIGKLVGLQQSLPLWQLLSGYSLPL